MTTESSLKDIVPIGDMPAVFDLTRTSEQKSQSTPITPPFCINCKHYRFDSYPISEPSWEYVSRLSHCIHPGLSKFDLVIGRTIPAILDVSKVGKDVAYRELPFCQTIRADETKCGQGGKWFEPKLVPPPLPKSTT